MAHQRGRRVRLEEPDLVGDYLVAEHNEDGSILLTPDTSIDAMRERLGLNRISDAEFDEGVDVYFCDPHSPWQRSSNENTNGLLRQYLPKSTDLAARSQIELDQIAAELNGRPRETLDCASPAEKMEELLR